MAGSGFMRSIVLVAALAISWAVALPARAVEAAGRFILNLTDGSIVRFIADLFRSPALAAAGGAPMVDIDPALATEQRHEAGLSRLGTVRHIS